MFTILRVIAVVSLDEHVLVRERIYQVFVSLHGNGESAITRRYIGEKFRAEPHAPCIRDDRNNPTPF